MVTLLHIGVIVGARLVQWHVIGHSLMGGFGIEL